MDISELQANKIGPKFNRNKVPFCTYCDKKGHLQEKCFEKYPELKTKKTSNNNKNKNTKSKKPNKETPKTPKSESNKLIMTTLSLNTDIDTDINIDTGIDNYNYSYRSATTKDLFTDTIVLDSGATEHYTPNKDWLLNYKEVKNKSIIVVNGIKLPILGEGDIPILIGNKEVTITKVNYIPTIKTTLISTKELTNKGWSILFKDSIVEISHSKLRFLFKAFWKENAYYLNILVNTKLLESIIYKVDPLINSNINKLDLIHKRLNHLNKDHLIQTIKNIDNTLDISNYNLSNCDSCIYGKIHEHVSYNKLKSLLEKLTFSILIYIGLLRY